MHSGSLRAKSPLLLATFALVILTLALTGITPAGAQGNDEIGTLLAQIDRLSHASQYREAGELTKRLLTLTERRFGPNHPNVATTLNNLGEFLRFQGRYAEAEPYYDRALAMAEKAMPRDDGRIGTMLSNIGQLYAEEGRYSDAEATYTRALALTEKALGPQHPTVALVLNNMAELDRRLRRFADAEPLYKRALAIDEKAAPNDPSIGRTLGNLSLLYIDQARYAEAEPFAQRALAFTERTLGASHPDLATRLGGLAMIYDAERRYADAEPLYKRALAIAEKTLGPDHPDVGVQLNNLGYVYDLEGRYDEAEPLYRRALAIAEKTFGPDHPRVATALNNIAALYRAEKRFAEAEPLYRRALAIDEKAQLPTARDLNNLGFLYSAEHRYGDAETLFARALAIQEKTHDAEHPDVATADINLAGLYFLQSDWARSVTFWRRASDIIERRTLRSEQTLGHSLVGKGESDAIEYDIAFYDRIKALYRTSPAARIDRAVIGETFTAAQWTQSSEAAQSLAEMAARGAAGDDKLAALIRERQDLVAEWQKRDATRSAALATPPERRDTGAFAANTGRLAAIDVRIAAIDAALTKDFPDYAALASPAPTSVEEVQAGLGPDEAMVLFLDTRDWEPTPEETFIWVITKTDARWVRSELGTSALTREVAALRCGLDRDSAWIGSRCNELLNIAPAPANGIDQALPFDLERSHALYQALFGQIEDVIKDKHLLIVPSGPLTQLPFQVLVTEPPASPRANDRAVAWLARKHAITVLPAVSSLKTLRQLARPSHAGEPYIGFGDPLLDGDPAQFPDDAIRAKLAREKQCALEPRMASVGGLRAANRAIAIVANGPINVADIRRQLPLPETADELCAVARDLGADPARSVYIGARATEATVKRLSDAGSLAKYRIVHFATHGLVGGELSGASEPGLLLTPPASATAIDDGYLRASEVAALKLDADWVILSACNTAAGDANGGSALSGLARAFFYAGARSLLVSHWSVNSDATVKLITKAAAELRANPKIGRAEALRRSMLSMIDAGTDDDAQPENWAPFVLVGEGGAMR
jgi:CHAT domain-containing protein/tetratricopeptide (TPR) repeat protein